MTPARSAIVAIAALLVVIGVAPEARSVQQPQGLMRGAEKGCTIETRPLSFGIYDTLATAATVAQGEVIYTCGNKTDAGGGASAESSAIKNIRIEISMGSAGSFQRQMASGMERLFYNVYLDAGYRTVWGDGSGGTDYYFDPHPPNKKPVTVPAYGRIQPMQDVAAGQYSDTLQVRILF